MAAIKRAARSATVAFSPGGSDILAAGTMAGAIDLSFSASASLDLFRLEFSDPNPDLPLVCSYPTTERFNRLSWGTQPSAGSQDYPFGLLAGGLSDGSVNIWNPAILMRDETDVSESLVTRLQKHSGPVRGLEFNVIAPNLLASGADDGELCIWDMSNPGSASLFPPLRSGGSGAQNEISYLSWNRKVPHILASTSYSGTSVVWDLKRQKPVISFTDPTSRRRCSVLQWNPDVATQLIVASDDDRSPSLQVWDLRNSVSPIKELVGHTKGVLAMAWCPLDSALLLTSAKDNRTLCWDTVSGEIVCELLASSNWNFDIQWSPRIAGIWSTSSFDGEIGIYNIEACSRALPSESVFGEAISTATTFPAMRAPKWLKRPVGVTFGFGGKLASFVPAGGATASLSEVRVHTMHLEDDLLSKTKDFEVAVAEGTKSSMRSLCDNRIQQSRAEKDKEIWSFLKIMFEENGKESLLFHLGFVEKPSASSKIEQAAENHQERIDEMMEGINLTDQAVEQPTLEQSSLLDKQSAAIDDGSDFFNNLGTPKGSISSQLAAQEVVEEKEMVNGWDNEVEVVDAEEECDMVIQNALVVADFKAAVEQCLSANRLDDALVLAQVAGGELWSRTLNEYLKNSRRPYRKVVSAIVARDTRGLVDGRPLKAWKETLALLCSYASPEEWTVLCGLLAAKLDAAGYSEPATLCYICALNVEKAVDLWSRDVQSDTGSLAFFSHLQDLVEKTVALAMASGEKHSSPALARVVGCYIEMLAGQGLLKNAMEYLSFVPDFQSNYELAVLHDRISKNIMESQPPSLSHTIHDFQNGSMPPSLAPNMPQNNSNHLRTLSSHLESARQSGSVPAYSPIEQPEQQTTSGVPPFYTSNHQQTPQQMMTAPAYSSGSVPSYNPTANQSPYFSPSIPQPPPSSYGVPQSSGHMQARSFIPSQPPTISNVGQYQQASLQPLQSQEGFQQVPSYPTLSQTPNMMLPGPALPAVKSAPMPGGFNPISAPTPSVAPQQSGSSVSTIQNADVNNVSAELKPVITTLRRLFEETSEAVGGAMSHPAKKREIEDNSRKLGALFAKLNSGDISPNAASKLVQLCQSLDTRDYTTALHIQVGLTTSDWDECSFWLAALKRMIKTQQSRR